MAHSGGLHLVPHGLGEMLVEKLPGFLTEGLAVFAQTEVHYRTSELKVDNRSAAARAYMTAGSPNSAGQALARRK